MAFVPSSGRLLEGPMMRRGFQRPLNGANCQSGRTVSGCLITLEDKILNKDFESLKRFHDCESEQS